MKFGWCLLVLVLGFVHFTVRAADDFDDQAGFKGMLWGNSLQPPFDEVTSNGHKQLENWVHGGSVQIKKNFVRLTPDKPSRTGYLFNKNAAPQDDFAILLRFRISGSSEQLSGDGLALWYTNTNTFVHGTIMGSSEVFSGFGILFDTYANDNTHRDVVVIASNGKQPIFSNQFSQFPGCNTQGKFRRWEGRGDFSVSQETVVKVSYQSVSKHLVVEVDALGTGKFAPCVDTSLSRFMGGKAFLDPLHFGLSATTGALHDNHDVLEMIVTQARHFSSVMEAHEQLVDEVIAVEIRGENTSVEEVGESVNMLAYEMKDLDGKLEKLQHEIEHEVEKIAHKLEGLIDQIRAQEKRLEGRVEELERKTQATVMRGVEQRLMALEQSLTKNIGSTTTELKTEIIKSKEEGTSNKFYFKAFVFVVLVGFAYLGFTLFRVNKKVAKESSRYL